MVTGLQPSGYVATTTQEEVDDLNALFLANIDGGLDLAPDQPIGQIIGGFAEKFAQLTELGSAVYNMLNPAQAEGQFLVNLAALSGTRPQVATYSEVTATLTLTAGSTVSPGAIASVANQPTNTWVLTNTVHNSGGSTAPIAGALFRSSLPGPFVANAGTLTVINSPTTGWLSVTNPADAVQGLAADTDTTLRQKREAELTGQGAGNVDAIRAALLKVPGVIQAFVFENTTLFGPDANGTPAKSFHAVIWDGPSPLASNTAIAQAIWDHKSSGSASFGTVVAQATDSVGNLHDILFDRAVQLPLFVSLTTTPGSLTTDQTNAVKAALAAYALATFNLGVSVIAVPFRCEAVIPGITTDVPTFAFDFHSSPTNTANLAVSGLQIVTLSTSNILVNGV